MFPFIFLAMILADAIADGERPCGLTKREHNAQVSKAHGEGMMVGWIIGTLSVLLPLLPLLFYIFVWPGVQCPTK